ncbi:collagen binding domain-containing protein [Paenibacillus dakarensis]|uniref:collagen binding domain-containing protein n=1 Tax=Paenibacillus dakarensis TaxID=1527293 RepID=UPI0006D5A113|nr:collagen binding domain-containing protein [Paenibacillus dakarensis]
MKILRQSMYVFLIAALMINVWIPSSFAIAADEGAGEGVITENLITSVVIKDEAGNLIETVRPDQGAKVQVNFEWKLPENHGYREGAAFSFHLPENFKIDSEKRGDLDGGIGTYVVTPEGEIILTFNEEINDQNELTGNFFVWRYFDEKSFSGGTHQEVVFKYNETEETTIPVHFKSKSGSEFDKSGKANKGMNASKIDWTADFNMGEKKIENAVFTDALPAGLSVDMSSIEVYPLDVQLDGSVVEGKTPASFASNPTANGFELLLGGIDSAYRVKYTTPITSTADATYKNDAALTGDPDIKLGDSDSVAVKFSKPLDKKSTGYESSTQTITWAIQYNYNEQAVPQAKAWIKDTFDKGHQKLAEDSFEVYEMTIDDNGKAKRTTGAALEKDQDYYVDNTLADGFKLTFQNEISKAYEIIYKTSAINRVHDDKVSVKNKVEIENGTSIEAGRDVGQVIFAKRAGKVDYAAKTIEWKISLNKDNKTMDKIVIKDSFAGQGLTFLPDSLSVSGLAPDNGDGTGDYTVEPNPTYEEGFLLTFKNPTSVGHDITYKTSFDSTRVNPNPYRNQAVLNWDEDNTQQPSITKSGEVDPDNYTKDNGHKTGTYNASTKEITWTIDVNYNLHKIKDAVVRDFYTNGQTFVPGSLTVHKLKLTGGSNGVDTGEEFTGYTFETKKENDKDGFELKLGEIDSVYRITYKTSLKGLPVIKDYSNEATLRDVQAANGFIFKKSAAVNPKYPGEYVMKTGKQGTGANADFAYWEVNINRSLSHIEKGAVLQDELSPNQILVKDSFKLYHNIVDAKGDLRKGSLVDKSLYTLEVQGNTFELVFKEDIESSFLLEYQSFINADHNEVINNKVSFQGQSSGVVDKNEHFDIKVMFSGAGGGANAPGKGNLKVHKVDAADGKTPLPGVRFGLYDKTGVNLLEELITDENGVAEFTNYKYKDYMLKELEAPAGYLIAPEYKAGKILKFKTDETDFTVANVQGNWDVELTKVDQDDQNVVLEGAVFKLQIHNGTEFIDVPDPAEFTTDTDGKIQLHNLKPGSYQFVETKAPKGYKLNGTPIPFTVDADQSAPKQLIAQNEIYIGSVELLKVDAATGETLQGAEFELWDTADNVVRTGLTTDQDGKLFVDQLKAGGYQFVEVKAPDDYVLSVTPLEFEILDDTKLSLEFKNSMNTGSVKLTKIEQGLPDVKLPGAQFRLLDANMALVKDSAGKELAELTTDQYGELIIPDLRPGKYYIEETRAPYGYLLEDKLTEITVIIGEEALVTIENIYIHWNGGGGGGETNPNPPVDPNPGEPVDPDPDKPVDPVEPEVPGDSGEPGESVDPSQPTDPSNPSAPSGNENPPAAGDPGDPSGNDHTGVTPNEGPESGDGNNGNTLGQSASPHKPNGNVLPKTGEDSRLPFQLVGTGFIMLGLALMILRKKPSFHKQ